MGFTNNQEHTLQDDGALPANALSAIASGLFCNAFSDSLSAYSCTVLMVMPMISACDADRY